jgi:hypothetical protein
MPGVAKDSTVIYISPRAHFWLHGCALVEDRPMRWLLDRWILTGESPGPVPKFPASLKASSSRERSQPVTLSKKARDRLLEIQEFHGGQGEAPFHRLVDRLMMGAVQLV